MHRRKTEGMISMAYRITQVQYHAIRDMSFHLLGFEGETQVFGSNGLSLLELVNLLMYQQVDGKCKTLIFKEGVLRKNTPCKTYSEYMETYGEWLCTEGRNLLYNALKGI